jgi:fumarate reductase subunit D
MSRRTPEPYLWLLFSGGGVAAAMLLPALVLILGLLVPLGVVSAPDLGALVSPWPVKVVVVGVVLLCLFHAAHRIRFTSEEVFRLGRFDVLIAPLCYGLALAGAVAAGLIVAAIP